VTGEPAALGSLEWLRERGVIPAGGPVVSAGGVGTVVAAARGGRLIGFLHLADEVRPSAAPAIAALQALGVHCAMLSGDSPEAAAGVARAVGLRDVQARVLPQDKAAEVARRQAAGGVVGMVGDGINDAPALAAADVSFAMAGGTGVALDAADVTIMRGDLTALAEAIELSRRTSAKIRQNLVLAFLYNVLGIPLAALGMLSPMIAGAAMAASSVSVVVNALLLNRRRSTLPFFRRSGRSRPRDDAAPAVPLKNPSGKMS